MDTSTITDAHTSRPTAEAEEFAIYDDFLPADEFAALAAYANNCNYHEVHEKGVRKVWRLHDGTPLQGETTYMKAASKPENGQLPPGQSPVHHFLARLNEVLDENSQLVGERLKDWKSVSAAPWVYPMGSGLSLHADSNRYSGSYTYFLHSRWGLHWGGYLMIFNPARYSVKRTAPYSSGFVLPWLSDEIEVRAFEDPGLAISIFPKPNRLALISRNAYHMVSRVDANAGQNPRVSVAGFFHIAE